MRILITGSRDWDDVATIENALLDAAKDLDDGDITLVSGNCPDGADALAEGFAEYLGWKVERHPADWDRHGKKAGFVRNCEMIDSAPDRCIAFIRNESKGATMTRDLSVFRGIPTSTHIYKEKQVFGKYVVGFAFDETNRVALILKERPPWQKGLFNGIGGKIEEDETPLDAMIREFDEETGVLISDWQLYATLLYPDSEIFFFRTKVPVEYLDELKTTTDELIYIFTLEEFNLKPSDCVRNLSWLLPLAMYNKAAYLPLSVVVTDFQSEGNDEVST